MSPWTFVTADDEELHDLLVSRRQPVGYPWPGIGRRSARAGEIGILVSSDSVRVCPPAFLVVSPEASRRLFGRYSQLRSDLSPLSSWTHILDWSQFDLLDGESRIPQLSGLEAAWVGLAIAEAMMLSGQSLAQLKLSACLATSSYAIARALALWPNENIGAVLERYDDCQKLFRSLDGTVPKLRGALIDVWEVLAELSGPLRRGRRPETRAIGEALRVLVQARAAGQDELHILLDQLEIPQSDRFRSLDAMPAEHRLKEFDRLVFEIGALSNTDKRLQNQLSFFAGYLATVAAGGEPSLSLAERLVSRYPQITAWAYVVGSIGERVTWTSGFDGLGRLVARELQRPFRIDEGPSCDFALIEAAALVDRALRDPFVHMRIKQARVLTVALMPGVNVTVPFKEPISEVRPVLSKSVDTELPRSRTTDNPIRILARALAPYLMEEIASLEGSSSSSARRGRSQKRQSRLPLDDAD